MDEEGFVLGIEDGTDPLQQSRVDSYVATEIIAAGSRLKDGITTINLSPEVITESEAMLPINNGNEEDDSQIL